MKKALGRLGAVAAAVGLMTSGLVGLAGTAQAAEYSLPPEGVELTNTDGLVKCGSWVSEANATFYNYCDSLEGVDYAGFTMVGGNSASGFFFQSWGFDAAIKAIQGGGTVVGFSCNPDGTVKRASNTDFVETFGPDATLYVVEGNPLWLEKTENYVWNIGSNGAVKDQVEYVNLATGLPDQSYDTPLDTNMTGLADSDVAVFKGKDGGPAMVPPGNGAYQMRFRSAERTRPPEILGTVYAATLSDGDYRCQPKSSGTSQVERVIHFAEGKNGKGRPQSNIKLADCDSPEGCVVGYGYNKEGNGKNWDNTFELWFRGDPGTNPEISVGDIPVVDRESEVNGRCSTGNDQGEGIVKKCFRLTAEHQQQKGEQPIKVDGVLIAEWDFFGDLSVGWGDGPDGTWDGYHVFLVQEGVSRDGQLNLNDSGFTDFCSAEGWDLLPNGGEPLTEDACFQQGVEVRAKFDWDNSADVWEESKDLGWLEAVIQFGSNELAHGDNAFRNMNARGGAAFEALDVSNLGSMAGMFRGAKFFDANLENWNVSGLGVGAPDDFDAGTDAWGPEPVESRDGTGERRPIWNAGQVIVSEEDVRAERASGYDGLVFRAANGFSVESVKGDAQEASIQSFDLSYSIGDSDDGFPVVAGDKLWSVDLDGGLCVGTVVLGSFT
jgi:hypothetical protein